MKIYASLIIICLFLNLIPMKAQPFSSFRKLVTETAPEDRQILVNRFLAIQSEIPLIESDTIVHFLYCGNAASVAIAGDATAWAPMLNMTRIEGTNLWYVTATYEKDTRLEYKVVTDDKNWMS